MRKVILYSACSLDFFIARSNGEVDWLFTENDYGYSTFYEGIDTTLIGYSTYEQIMGFEGPFPYTDKSNYVFSRRAGRENNAYVSFISQNIVGFVQELKQEEGKNIWLVGGGQINTIMLLNDLVDEIVLSVHPVFLGSGIKLFEGNMIEKKLKLQSSKSFDDGLMQLSYRVE